MQCMEIQDAFLVESSHSTELPTSCFLLFLVFSPVSLFLSQKVWAAVHRKLCCLNVMHGNSGCFPCGKASSHSMELPTSWFFPCVPVFITKGLGSCAQKTLLSQCNAWKFRMLSSGKASSHSTALLPFFFLLFFTVSPSLSRK